MSNRFSEIFWFMIIIVEIIALVIIIIYIASSFSEISADIPKQNFNNEIVFENAIEV